MDAFETSDGKPKVLFSDFFGLSAEIVDSYGAFDVSLVSDLPLFIDPFLLFNSEKSEYQVLHEEMIQYLKFLRDKSLGQEISSDLLAAWYHFKEVRQNWLGFSRVGNRGSALGKHFASNLNSAFRDLFSEYGREKVTKASHLEKLCLIREGVGRDNISDFTTNLIKDYLLKYTQEFARKYLDSDQRQLFRVPRAKFSYTTESWITIPYELPCYQRDYVLLTPKDILTRDDTWINSSDLVDQFVELPGAIPDDALRAQINNYFRQLLGDKPTKKRRARSCTPDNRALPYPHRLLHPT